MGFQPGNKLGGARQKKPARDALMIELKAAGDNRSLLREIWQKVIALALEGEQWAVKEIMDRTDGKPPQAVIGDDDEDAINVIHRIERIIVTPQNTDGGSVPPAADAGSV